MARSQRSGRWHAAYAVTTRTQTLSSRIDIPLTAALLAVPVVAALASTPPHLQMPAMSAFAMLAAVAVAALAFVTRADRRAGAITLWDFAGACALIGIAAGMFSQQQHVISILRCRHRGTVARSKHPGRAPLATLLRVAMSDWKFREIRERSPALFDLVTPQVLAAFFQVIMIDLVLAGDNAIVIGLAAAGLPAHQRTQAILIGIAAATGLRVVFALMTTQLLQIVGLLFAGGVLLLWVCWKMWRELSTSHAVEVEALEAVSGRRHQCRRHHFQRRRRFGQDFRAGRLADRDRRRLDVAR